jgi:hypothetical protein
MPKLIITLVLFCLLTLPRLASACGIEGSATWSSDGAPVDGSARVTTSYTSYGPAYVKKGSYSLDLGSTACGNRVEVYVNSYLLRTVSIPSQGNARVDFVMKSGSDMPVR